MGSEKFCLRWNDFESNISSAFRELRDDKDFFDITLACDDEQIQAHKVILSACSPFFRNVLRRNPHQHPLLYLKGVKYTDLQSVLNFMYHGEVNVAQEELNSFLAVAEDLKVKGLTQNQSQAENTKTESHNPPPKAPQQIKTIHRPPARENIPIANRPRPPPPPSYTTDSDDIQELVPVKSEPTDPLPMAPILHHQPAPPPDPYPSQPGPQALAQADDQGMAMTYHEENYEDYGEYEVQQEYGDNMGVDMANKDVFYELDAQINTMMYKSDKAWHCAVCEKTSHGKSNISRHIEATHLENHPGLNCDICGETAKSRNALRVHMAAKHR